MKYRRIPGEPIEAGQWGYDIWIANRHPGIFFEEGLIGWHVVTIHGQKTKIIDGDWILPEPDGVHFYSCKPEVFAKTYEPVDTPEAIVNAMTDAMLHGHGAVRIVHVPGVVSNREPASSSGLPDDWFEEHDGQRLVLSPEKVKARIVELEAQLQAEGEHTAAANANIDRLNTEIERVTRRQQGPLMGKE